MRLVALGLVATATLTAATQPPDSLAEGRRLTALAYTSPQQFIDGSDPAFVAKSGGAAKLAAYLTSLQRGAAGVKLDSEAVYRAAGALVYTRTSRLIDGTAARSDIFIDRVTGKVTNFTISPVLPKAPNRRSAYRSKVRLTLPFGDPPVGTAWHAIWAGETLADNYHAGKDTHFAIDIAPRAIAMLDRPASADQAQCWGLPILAAADGTVVAAVSDQPDYLHRRTKNPGSGPGNQVIIDHGNGEFAQYAHLKKDSVLVKAGDRVTRAQQVGQCGNSGGSTAPHLHFQLMDGPDLNTAEGLPLVFHDYFAPVRHVSQGTLSRGDFVLPGLMRQP